MNEYILPVLPLLLTLFWMTPAKRACLCFLILTLFKKSAYVMTLYFSISDEYSSIGCPDKYDPVYSNSYAIFLFSDHASTFGRKISFCSSSIPAKISDCPSFLFLVNRLDSDNKMSIFWCNWALFDSSSSKAPDKIKPSNALLFTKWLSILVIKSCIFLNAPLLFLSLIIFSTACDPTFLIDASENLIELSSIEKLW